MKTLAFTVDASPGAEEKAEFEVETLDALPGARRLVGGAGVEMVTVSADALSAALRDITDVLTKALAEADAAAAANGLKIDEAETTLTMNAKGELSIMSAAKGALDGAVGVKLKLKNRG